MADNTKSEAIKQFNAKQQAKASQANPGVPPTLVATANMSTADIALIQKSQDANQTLTADEQIKLKALETKGNLGAAAKQQQALLEAQKEQERKDAKLHQKVILTTSEALDAAGNPITPAANWFANLPTVGGIATILLLILVFLMAIVPVNAEGDTRLKLVWFTLTGKTHLRYQENGASANSGNTTANNQQQGYQVPIVPLDQNVNTLTPPTNNVQPSVNLPDGVSFLDLLGGSL